MDPGIEEHLAAGRHARAFDLVVPAYRDRVFRLAYSILRDRAAAEDAAQETFVRIWKALPGFDGRAALGTWIYAIARNTSLMELRRRRPSVSFDDPDSIEEAVRLFYLEDRSYEAVAEQLGMPLGTVKNLLHRARKRLMELVRPDEVIAA